MDAIAVDRFTRGVDACVLTHAHTDHTSGLDRVRQSVHCSEQTLGLLATMGRPTRQLVGHPYYKWFRLTPNTNCVFLQANHCLGSAMLLLESAHTRQRMLYTGDMRYEDPERMPARLRKCVREQLPAQWCMDDSLVEHRQLPARAHMCDEVVRLATEANGPVHLRGELLGQEPVIAALLAAGVTVHVQDEETHARLRYYLTTTKQRGLLRGVLPDVDLAQVHVARQPLRGHTYALRIHLGVRWHSQVAGRDPHKHPVVHDPSHPELVHVAYTSHASGNELRGFIRSLGLLDKRRVAETVKGCRTGIIRI